MSTSPQGPGADTFTGTGRRHFRCRRDKQVVSFGFSHPGDQQQWMGYVTEILYLMCTYQTIIVPNMYTYISVSVFKLGGWEMEAGVSGAEKGWAEVVSS